MSFLADIAERARYTQFWSTPYRTGNLARSIGEINEQGRETGYRPFNASGEANYGWLLNETPRLRYKTVLNDRVFYGEYQNRHYLWFDKFVDNFSDEIDIELGAIK